MTHTRDVVYVGTDAEFASSLADALAADASGTDWSFDRVAPGDDLPAGTDVSCLVVEDDPPASDGLELVESLDGVVPPFRVVLLGTDGRQERAADALAAGVGDYLPKPASAPSLVADRVRSAADAADGSPTGDRRRDWYRAIVEQSATPLIVVAPDGTQKYVSPSVESLTGHRAADLEGDAGMHHVHPDDREAFTAALESVVADGAGASTTLQYRYRHADGAYHAYESTLTNRLDDPTLEGVIVTARRITERKRLEAELEAVFGRVSDAFYALDGEFRFTYVNDRAEELLQHSEAELLGERVWEVFPEATESPAWDSFHEALETQEPTSYDVYFEPLEFWVEANVYPSEDGLSVYFRDVTDRKRRELELERYETIVESVGDGVYVLDEDSRFVMVNEAYLELTGYAREELLGETATVVTGDEVTAEMADVQAAFDRGDREDETLETVVPTADGDRVPVQVTITRFPFEDGSFGRVGIVRDVTARKRFERTLAALHESTRGLLHDESREAVAHRVLETAVDVLEIPVVAVYLAGEDDVLRPAAYSEEVAELFGDLDAAEFGPGASSITRHAYDAGETVAFDDVTGTDLAYTDETPLRSGVWIPLGDHGVVGIASETEAAFDDDDHRLAELLAATAESALDRVERDHERDRRRSQLARLNVLGQELIAAETREEAARGAVEAVRDVLDVPVAAIEGYDGETGGLRPVARTPASHDGGPLFSGDEDPVWRAYARGTGTVLRDLLAETDVSPDETTLRSAIVLPLGGHGVFVCGAPEPNDFSENDVEIAEILAGMVQAALDSVAREQTLRDQADELERKTASLERLNRINELIRSLTRSLTQATTREEIDRAVCAQLVQADPYPFVWIGDTTVTGDEVAVRSSAGEGDGYLEAAAGPLHDSADPSPSAAAAASGRVHVENRIHDDPPLDPWRQAALAAGFHSAIAVPLGYRDSVYGVLAVYADEGNAFSEMEQAVLGELGEMVGYAINAIERKQALVSDRTVELGFSVADPAVPVVQFAREQGAGFEFETLVSEADGSLRAFFTVTGADPEAVTSFAERTSVVSSVELVADQDCGHLFEAVTSEDGFLGSLLEHGARVTELVADESEARLLVELPATGDVKAFIDMFLSAYDDVELVSRREVDQSIRTEQQFRSVYLDRLTDRQEEVLRTAYASGFFEWPRDVTGQEVADSLGVSQPTVNRHVRTGQRKLFELVFGDE